VGDLQPLALPDTPDPLVVDCPARLAQQFGDLAGAAPGRAATSRASTPASAMSCSTVRFSTVSPPILLSSPGNTAAMATVPRGLHGYRDFSRALHPQEVYCGRIHHPSSVDIGGHLPADQQSRLENEFARRSDRLCHAIPLSVRDERRHTGRFQDRIKLLMKLILLARTGKVDHAITVEHIKSVLQ
jgi:hypothetical protein